MPLLLLIVVLAIGGLLFHKTRRGMRYLIVLVAAVGVASFATFCASVLVLSKIDGIFVSGSGLIEVPACILLWLAVFAKIYAARPPKLGDENPKKG